MVVDYATQREKEERKTKDLLEVMELWLSTNIQAHAFISRD